MPVEIERKFLIKEYPHESTLHSVQKIKQGYLTTLGRNTVRVRTVKYTRGVVREPQAFLTVKGRPRKGRLGKPEYEYLIPNDEAKEMMHDCGSRIIHKERSLFYCQHNLVSDAEDLLIWEIDRFKKKLKTLFVAEIELPKEGFPLILPSWVGLEVTEDRAYKNKQLAIHQRIPEHHTFY